MVMGTSVVPVPDGTETQEMCPRDFQVFGRFPQYSGIRKYVYGFRNVFTVSEVCLRFPKYVYGFRNILTYPGVAVPLEYCTTTSGVLLDLSDSEFGPRCHVTLEGAELSRSWEPSCHAPVKKLGGYPGQGGLPGRLPREGVQKGARCTLSLD